MAKSSSGWLRPGTVIGAALIMVLAVSVVPGIGSAQNDDPFLGAADVFAVLGGESVTNTGPSVIHGDLGVSPGSSVTGFDDPGGPGIVNGTIHITDEVAANAQSDVTTAYNVLAGRSVTATLTGQDLGTLAEPLVPGVYFFESTAHLTGTLTLNAQGDPDAEFIFQIGSGLTTESASSVEIINGFEGSHCNIYWQVGSSATLGTDTDFQGNILALASITLNTRATIDGRALARTGSTTLDTNVIDSSACVTPLDDDTVSDDTVSDDTVSDDTVSDDTVSDDTVSDDTVSDDTPPVDDSDDTPPVDADDTVSDDTVSDDTPPVDDSDDTPPVDDSDDTPPVDDSDDTPPVDDSDDTPPVDDSDDTPPVDDSDDTPPVDDSDDTPPVDDSDDTPPVDDSDDTPPVDDSDDTPPVDDSDDTPPVDDSDDTPPVDDSDDTPPVDDDKGKTPPTNDGKITLPKTGSAGFLSDGYQRVIAPSGLMLVAVLLLVGGGAYIQSSRHRYE